MDFDDRFKDMFHDEKEFPEPLPVSIKKSFSEKFFRAGANIKFPGKNTLNIRRKLTFLKKFSNRENREDTLTKKKEIEIEIKHRHSLVEPIDNIDLATIHLTPPHLSRSVECLPISGSSDSFLPLSNHSSVISLPKFKTLKVSNRSKFATFKRGDPFASPYGSIFKARNRLRPELKDFDPPISFSPLPYTLPIAPFSIDVDTLNDSKANFYGQDLDKSSLARTDYSYRVSTNYWKNVEDNIATVKSMQNDSPTKCKEVKTPQLDVQNEKSESDLSFFEDSLEPKSSAIHYHDNFKDFSILNSNFQNELLSRCSKIKMTSEVPRSENNDVDVSPEKENLTKQNGDEPCPGRIVSCRTDSLSTNSDNSHESSSSGKPEIFPKPKLSTKKNLSSLSTKLDQYPRQELSLKPNILPKPNFTARQNTSLEKETTFPDKPLNQDPPQRKESFPKPEIPIKPNLFKIQNQNTFSSSVKASAVKSTTEINNNCIILDKYNSEEICKSKQSGENCYNSVSNKLGQQNCSGKIVCNQKETTSRIILCGRNENQKTTETSTIDECEEKLTNFYNSSNSLKVRDLVASFNKVILSTNDIDNDNNNNFNLAENKSEKFLYTQKLIQQTLVKNLCPNGS